MKKANKMLSIILTLALLLTLSPTLIMPVSAAPADPIGQLSGHPFPGNMSIWGSQYIDYVNTALKGLASFLPDGSIPNSDDIAATLDTYIALLADEYIPGSGDHTEVDIEGSAATITIGECDIYDYDVGVVLGDAAGKLTLTAEDIELLLKDPGAKLALTGAEIQDLLSGTLLTLSADLSMSGAVSLTQDADIDIFIIGGTLCVTAICEFDIAATLNISIDIGTGEITGGIINPLVNMEFMSASATASGIIPGVAAEVINSYGTDSTIKDLIDGNISLLTDPLKTFLENPDLFDTLSAAFQGAYDDLMDNFEISITLEDVLDMVSGFVQIPADVSFDVPIPYSFAYEFTGLVNGTQATVDLDDIVDDSWLHYLTQQPYDAELYLSDLSSLAGGALPSDLMDQYLVGVLGGLLGQALDSTFAAQLVSQLPVTAIADSLQNVLQGLLDSAMVSIITAVNDITLPTIPLSFDVNYLLGTYPIDLNLQPEVVIDDATITLADGVVEENLNNIFSSLDDIAGGLATKLVGLLGVVADNIGVAATLSSVFDPGEITGIRLANVDITEKDYTLTVTSTPASGGKTVQMSASLDQTLLMPNSNATLAYNYDSDNSSIAAVDSAGLVTRIGNGTATVTASASFICDCGRDKTVTDKTVFTFYTYGGGLTAYTVTFDTNGGSAVSSQSISYSGKAIKPADPKKDGFEFVGWYADAALTSAYDFNASVTCNITLYVKWATKIKDEEVSLAGQNPFKDVKEGDWFYDDVMYVYENGLMNGTSGDMFSPNGTLTRGMVVTILYRLEGEPSVVDLVNPFADVLEGTWYINAVRWAAANDIVFGYGDGRYGPNDSITREQLVAILYRYAQYAGIDVSVGENTNILSYVDAFDVSEYAVPAMQWACGVGVISGKPGGYLDPQGSATRAEAAVMLHRFGRR